MPRKIWKIDNFSGGLSPYERVNPPGLGGSYLRGVQLDHRSDPSALIPSNDEYALNSAPTTIDLSKWIVPGGLTTQSMFFYGNMGFVKRRLMNGVYNDLTSHASSTGQGISYWAGDDFLYLAGHTQIHRFGPLATSTPSLITNWNSMLPDPDYHPILPFRDTLCFGNGRQLATWDGVQYINNRVIFPAGWRVRSLENWGDHLAIGCWRGTTLDEHPKGMVFFWDGVSSTYNFFIETEGAVGAMKRKENDLLLWLGARAELWRFNGALTKITDIFGMKSFPDLHNYVDIFPGSVTDDRGLTYFGIAGYASAPSIAKGIYSYGSIYRGVPDTLEHEFIGSGNISLAHENSSNRFIGGMAKFRNVILASVREATPPVNRVLEIDRFGSTSLRGGVQSRGRFESLVFDDNDPTRKKRAIRFLAHFNLVPNRTFQFFYRTDGGSWRTLSPNISSTTIPPFEISSDPLPFDFYELQLGFEGEASGTENLPNKLFSMELEFQAEERKGESGA